MNGNSVANRPETVFTVSMTKTQKRQTCSKCHQTTTDYTTRLYDRRTYWQILSNREAERAIFHTCRTCLPHAKDQVQLVCPTCNGKGQTKASWGELYHCLTCACSGKVWVDTDTCTGEAYPVNPDAPEEGSDLHHSRPCPEEVQ